VERALPALRTGRLRLILPSGDIIERCGRDPGPEAVLQAHRWRALWRILIGGEGGFADGYLDGDWSTPDLGHLLELLMANEAALGPKAKSSRLSRARNRLLHRLRANTRRGSRRNIAAHYDLGNDFYRLWLDDGMSYSSALYASDNSLERAQDAKLDRIVSLLELTGGESILEIGCGWGALAERLLRRCNANLFAVTLSAEQLGYARTRLAAEIEQGKADLRLLDYREIAGRFDRIASIEMLEAVGERYWPLYFGKLSSSLRRGGVAVLQVITIAEDRFDAYRKRPDFIQRYIFPGGMLPTRSIIGDAAARAGFVLTHHESFGDSYARTLREWRERFLRAWPKIERLGFDDRFRRMWDYYLAYCEVGFRTGAVDVGFFKLVQ
jgi:cyclopropane-fatty-acyl-phospholipid synthase